MSIRLLSPFRAWWWSFLLLATPAFSQVVTHFRVSVAGSDDPISSLSGLQAGVPFDVRVTALDDQNQVVTTYSKDVTLTIRAGFDYSGAFQDSTTAVPAADFVDGVADNISVTPLHAATAYYEFNQSGIPIPHGARFRASDGTITSDNASGVAPDELEGDVYGYFDIDPAQFGVTYSGGTSAFPGLDHILTPGNAYYARITAYNADGSVSTGWFGSVDLTSAQPEFNGASATIFSNGIVEGVPLTFNAMSASDVSIDATSADGVVITLGVVGPVTIMDRSAGGILKITDSGIYRGGTQAGENTVIRYKLNNSTNPAVDEPGPIDVHFVILDGNNAPRLAWTDHIMGGVAASTTTAYFSTSFVMPLDFTTGAYRLRIQPGYNDSDDNAAQVGITLNNAPDLDILYFNYTPGEYRAGEAFQFDLAWSNENIYVDSTNTRSSAMANNVIYRVEIHLSENQVFGDADDFLVWQESFVGDNLGNVLEPGGVVHIRRNAKFPTNYAGSYFILAKINSTGERGSAQGVANEHNPTTVTTDLSSGSYYLGNDIWLGLDATKITLLPAEDTDTTRVSVTTGGGESNGTSDNASVSRDGRLVVFESRGLLDELRGQPVEGVDIPVGYEHYNVYLRNIEGDSTTAVSISSGSVAPDGDSQNASISGDGRYVVFQSTATNLVPGDTGGFTDVFVRDVELGITRRLSVNPLTGQAGNANSQLPSISYDGRFVVFESSARNLTSDTVPSGVRQVYLYDRDVSGSGVLDTTGNTSITLIKGASAAIAQVNCQQPRISGDGAYVVFMTKAAAFLGALNPYSQVVRWERSTGSSVVVSSDLLLGGYGDNDSGYPAINGSGEYIVFASKAHNLTQDTYSYTIPQVFRARVTSAGLVDLIRMNSVNGTLDNEPSPGLLTSIQPALGSYAPSISEDGTLVAFASESYDLVADIGVRGVDGRTFQSRFVQNYFDGNFVTDVYLYDLTVPSDPVVDRASVSRFGYEATPWTLGTSAALYLPYSTRPSVSPNGRYVAFSSDAKDHNALIFGTTNYDYVALNGSRDIYLFDRKTDLVQASNRPTVVLRNPDTLTLAGGTSVALVADAASELRSVSSVEFYANNLLVGTAVAPVIDGTGRFQVLWTAPVLGSGNSTTRSYEITAIAVDSSGVRSLLSNLSRVTVVQTQGLNAPSVYVANPVSRLLRNITASSYPANGTITIYANTLVRVVGYTDNTNNPGSNGIPGGRPIIQVAETGLLYYLATDDILTALGADTFTNASTINLSAQATDTDGDLVKVEFYINGSLVGTVYRSATLHAENYPFVMPWAVPAVGMYTIVAVATDSSGLSTMSPPSTFRATVGTSPPVFTSFKSSLNSTAILGNSTTLTATVTDDGVVQYVDFYANGIRITRDFETPYTATYTPTESSAYALTAVAVDDSGNRTASPIITLNVLNVPAPTDVSLTVGSTSIIAGQSTLLSAAATPASGKSITTVTYSANGQLIATVVGLTAITWAPTVPGSYSLTAEVTDSAGNTVLTSPVTVTVSPNSPPVLALVSPGDGAQVGIGETIPIRVSAVDPDGSVASVTFSINGTAVAVLTSAPYVYNWTPVASGRYTISISATDDLGADALPVGISAVVPQSVTVSPVGDDSAFVTQTYLDLLGSYPTSAEISYYLAALEYGTITRGGLVKVLASRTEFYRWTQVTACYRAVFGVWPSYTQIAGYVSETTTPASGFLTSELTTLITEFFNSPLYIAQYGPLPTIDDTAQRPYDNFAPLFTRVYNNLYGSNPSTQQILYAYHSARGDAVSPVPVTGGFPQYLAAVINANAITSGSAQYKYLTGVQDVVFANEGRSFTPIAVYIALVQGAPGTEGDSWVAGDLESLSNDFVLRTGYRNRFITVTSLLINNAAHDLTLAIGSSATFSVTANGLAPFTYQWYKDGIAIVGATSSTYTIPVVTAIDAGLYSVAITNSGGVVAFSTTRRLSVADAAPQLFNVSTRAHASSGEATMIAGFVVEGSQPADVLVRGIGQTLANRGVSSPNPDPQLTIYDSTGSAVAHNDNWVTQANAADIVSRGNAALAAPMESDKDAAILTSLQPGLYTAHVTGTNGASGVALAEVWDLSTSGSSVKTINLSTRAELRSGDEAYVIAGFVIKGTSPHRVLMRAVGPTLSVQGVTSPVADPALRLYNSAGEQIYYNDNWSGGGSSGLISELGKSVGAFPLPAGSKDAAMVVQLEPGLYTLHATSVDGSYGVVLVEVYDLEP